MGDPVKLLTTTPLGNQIEITVKRWFQSRELWVQASSLVLIVAPIITSQIGGLGLSSSAVFAWTIIVAVLNFGATQYLHSTSQTIVMGKDAYRAAKDEAQTVASEASLGDQPSAGQT